jgi:hypothetical protein
MSLPFGHGSWKKRCQNIDMAVTYVTGEVVEAGDQVVYAGKAGYIEFVAAEGHPETGWYFERCGDCVMVVTPAFGRVCISAKGGEDEDLEFISRR